MFILLAVELTLNFILVLPLFTPLRKAIIGVLRLMFKSSAARTFAFIVALLLVYSFGFSYYSETRLSQELERDGSSHYSVVMDATKELGVRVRVFREQRNMYLSGFSFFHGIILWRLVKLYDSFDEKNRKVESAPVAVAVQEGAVQEGAAVNAN